MKGGALAASHGGVGLLPLPQMRQVNEQYLVVHERTWRAGRGRGEALAATMVSMQALGHCRCCLCCVRKGGGLFHCCSRSSAGLFLNKWWSPVACSCSMLPAVLCTCMRVLFVLLSLLPMLLLPLLLLPLLPAVLLFCCRFSFSASAADEEADTDAAKDTSAPTAAAAVGSKRPAVLADGTYATQVWLFWGNCLGAKSRFLFFILGGRGVSLLGRVPVPQLKTH